MNTQVASSEPPLSQSERVVLDRLIAQAGQVVSREQLLEALWGARCDGVVTRTVDMHISTLRRKLEASDVKRGIVLTLRGQGYMFTLNERRKG